ncbi:MAG: Fe-S cluster assembly protein SufD [Candidatus Omnitrophica bacterium]|nr:Fe-S cluster assembly protein SufD [Candidatus Omnitrophota bacterium]
MSTEGMTMTAKPQIKNPILERLKDESQKRIDGSVPWLSQLRHRSWERFSETGVPTTRHEEWKYFNLSGLPSLIQEVEHSVDASSHDVSDYLDPNDLNIVFVNGVFSSKLSNINQIPNGIVVAPLAESVASQVGHISDLFNRTSVNDPEPFLSLNTSLFKDGAFIKIDNNVILEKIIHVLHVTSPSGNNVTVFPRTVIIVGKSAQASILESYVAIKDGAYFINPVTDMQVGENAVLNYYKCQADGPNAVHIGAVRVLQEANSQLEAFALTVGASMARNNISVASDGEGADSILDGLYILSSSQQVDNHTLIDHRKPNCTSHQLYKGILNDQSHAVFNGKIFVRPIAQKTNSYQLNKHLLLGKDSRVDTKPQLEIFADDVKCTHGATIGQLNEDEIFYFQTRCISKDDAIRMLSRGFVDDLLDKLRDQNVRQKLSRLLSKKINLLRS